MYNVQVYIFDPYHIYTYILKIYVIPSKNIVKLLSSLCEYQDFSRYFCQGRIDYL